MKKLLIIIMCFVFVACTGQTIKPENLICNNIPEGSYSVICAVSDYIGIQPEDAGKVLRLGNIAGLASDAYTAQQANDFIEDIRSYLERAQGGYGLLYETLINYAEKKYNVLPKKVRLAIILIEEFGTVDISMISGADKVLSDYDYSMLFKHLDDQQAIIMPFLVI